MPSAPCRPLTPSSNRQGPSFSPGLNQAAHPPRTLNQPVSRVCIIYFSMPASRVAGPHGMLHNPGSGGPLVACDPGGVPPRRGKEPKQPKQPKQHKSQQKRNAFESHAETPSIGHVNSPDHRNRSPAHGCMLCVSCCPGSVVCRALASIFSHGHVRVWRPSYRTGEIAAGGAHRTTDMGL